MVIPWTLAIWTGNRTVGAMNPFPPLRRLTRRAAIGDRTRSGDLVRPRRAFTLVEVIVVLAIGSLMVLMVIGWITSLAETSATNLEQNAASGNFTSLSTSLGADITGAVTCDPNGFGVPIYQVGSYTLTGVTYETLQMYELDAGGTYDDLVLWQWSTTTGIIQRAVLTGSAGSCTGPASPNTWVQQITGATTGGTTAALPTWVTVTPNVTSATLVASYQGTPAPLPSGSPLVCTGAAGSSSDPTNCYFDTIEMKATVVNGAGQSSTGKFDQAWAVNLSGSKVAP